MTTLNWILAASLLGGVFSVFVAWMVTSRTHGESISLMVSYAIGALLGAVFLDLLPAAFHQQTVPPQHIALTILVGILSLFILEKLLLWRHCHADECESHTPVSLGDHGRTGLIVTIGDVFHNFVDGVLIAAAFTTDVHLGIIVSVAMVTHEIPQEIGDFLILLHSGYSRRKALIFNIGCSFATLLGAVSAWFALDAVNGTLPYVLGLAASSMVYVAMADLIPSLHKRLGGQATIKQGLLIASGIASILLVEKLLDLGLKQA